MAAFGLWSALLAAMALVAAYPPPGVNEAHYLCKARHAADPAFAPGDLFLTSGNAHFLFAHVAGRAARWVSLPSLAWTGRWLAWGLLAASWLYLFRALGLGSWAQLGAGSLLLWLSFATPMSGEWIVGGLEAKALAFPAATMALAAFATRRYGSALAWAGLATAWHVLVGGWVALLIAAGIAVAAGPSGVRRLHRPLIAGALVGGVLGLVGLVPALRLSWQVPAPIRTEAAMIYVAYRLPHHLLFQAFPASAVVRHIAAWCLFAGLLWRGAGSPRTQRLMTLVLLSAGLSVVGLVLSGLFAVAPDRFAPWLRFYWFRTADWLLPVGLSVAMFDALRDTAPSRRAVWNRRVALAIGLLAWADFMGGRLHSRPIWDCPPAMRQSGLLAASDRPWREVRREWEAVCRWIREHTPRDAIFLTPRHQQTFKWYAERAEVVCWKDLPQDPVHLVEWRRRMAAIYPPSLPWRGLSMHGPARLAQLAHTYGARYVLVDRRRSRQDLPWPICYAPAGDVAGGEAIFVVYRVPQGNVNVQRQESVVSAE